MGYRVGKRGMKIEIRPCAANRRSQRKCSGRGRRCVFYSVSFSLYTYMKGEARCDGEETTSRAVLYVRGGNLSPAAMRDRCSYVTRYTFRVEETYARYIRRKVLQGRKQVVLCSSRQVFIDFIELEII